jgi:hypothetical protein
MNTVVETISINGVEYVKKDAIQANSEPIGEVRIIVADRGWVFVGNCQDNEDGSVTITNARNIRDWGTTKGLGELRFGPIPNKTKYDEYGTVRCVPIVAIGVNSGW